MKVWKFIVFKFFIMAVIFGVLFAACSSDGDAEPSTGQSTAPVVPPNIPINVAAKVASSTSITITWSKVSSATSYDVYCETTSTTIIKLTTVTGNTYTHSGLQPDTTYIYYVSAKNSAGESDFSSPASATTPLNSSGNPPLAPTDVAAAVLSSSSIRVSWNPVSGASSYDVYYEIGSSSAKNFADNVFSSPYTHTGLESNTTYRYYIKARNSAGESSFSSSATITTPIDNSTIPPASPIIPQSPTGVTAATLSSSSIRVSWNPVSGATGYDIYYEIGSSTNKNFAGSIANSPYTHTSLEQDTTYCYYIKAKNSAGASDFSSSASAKTQLEEPNTPTGLTAKAISSSSISLSWNSVSKASGYYVYRSTSSSGSYPRVASLSSTTYTDTDLSAGKTYYYKVTAYNSAGEGYGSYASAKTIGDSASGGSTTLLAAPTGVTVSAVSGYRMSVKWNSVTGAAGYRVYYVIGTSTTKILATTIRGSATSYTHTNLQERTKYTYYITALDSNDEESDYSIPDSATTIR